MLEYNKLINKVNQDNLFQTFSRTYTKQANGFSIEKYLKSNQTLMNNKHQLTLLGRESAFYNTQKTKPLASKQQKGFIVSQAKYISEKISRQYATISDSIQKNGAMFERSPYNNFLKKRMRITSQNQHLRQQGFSLKQCGMKSPSYENQFQNDQSDFSIIALNKKINIQKSKTMKSRLVYFMSSGKRTSKLNSISAWGRTTKQPKFDLIVQKQIERPWTVGQKTNSNSCLIRKKSEKEQI